MEPMFPDLVPKARPAKRRDRPCCEKGGGIEDRAMAMLHTLAHSRVPFTDGHVGDITERPQHLAARLCNDGAGLGWIVEVGRVGERGRLWQGRL